MLLMMMVLVFQLFMDAWTQQHLTNPQANVDDGSCFATVLGCIDSLALNYDVFANSDDGSCVYSGCTDQLSWNYNPEASIDDGSCFEIPDCNTDKPS